MGSWGLTSLAPESRCSGDKRQVRKAGRLKDGLWCGFRLTLRATKGVGGRCALYRVQPPRELPAGLTYQCGGSGPPRVLPSGGPACIGAVGWSEAVYEDGEALVSRWRVEEARGACCLGSWAAGNRKKRSRWEGGQPGEVPFICKGEDHCPLSFMK